MVALLKYWLRYVLALCLIAVIAYMITCSILVTYLIAKGCIKIRMISDGRYKRNKRKWR